VKERPIIFSGPMVRAILEGRKTMTRRVIKLDDLTRHPDGDKWYGDMPRALSRILLEISAVRVERVQDISEEDAKAEGMWGSAIIKSEAVGMTAPSAIIQFVELWDSINTKRGYGWDANPWVWVIEFKLASSASEGEGE